MVSLSGVERPECWDGVAGSHIGAGGRPNSPCAYMLSIQAVKLLGHQVCIALEPVGRSSRMQDFFGKIYGKVANAQNWAFLVKFEKQNGEAEQELEFELKNILNGMKAFREKMMAMSSACK